MTAKEDWTHRRGDYSAIIIIMGLMGAFLWAIRGTGGFGGETGGILAGLGWGALWLGFSQMDGQSRRRAYGTAAALAAITFGMAYGGFTGYGVYTAWVRGDFYLDHPHGVRAIAAWTGYAMLFMCGLHWGGVSGAFLAWCGPNRKVGSIDWGMRIVLGLGGAVGALVLVRTFPQWFLPFYDEGIYQVEANKTCIRAENSIRTIAPHVGLFAGFLLAEIIRRDWRAVGMMLVVGLGFAVPFAVGGFWHTMQDSDLKLSWWKNWEMTIGLGGGLALGAAFWLFNRPQQVAPRPVSVKERVFGVGVPVALAMIEIVRGTRSGFIRLHDIDLSKAAMIGFDIAVTVAAIGLFAVWVSKSRQRQAFELPLAGGALTAIVGVIVAAGFIVSVPPKTALANNVLLALYVGYVGISAICFAWMRRHGRES